MHNVYLHKIHNTQHTQNKYIHLGVRGFDSTNLSRNIEILPEIKIEKFSLSPGKWSYCELCHDKLCFPGIVTITLQTTN